MVLNRRLEYGFRGYQVPATPRAARSVRSRGSTTKKAENHKLEAFDVLATVAGELLLENDGHPASSNSSAQQDGGVNTENTLQEEQPGGCGSMENKPHDHHISAKSFIISEVLPQDHGQNLSCKFKIADGCNWDSGSFNRKLEDEVKTLSNGEQLVSAKASLGSDTEMHSVEDIVVSNAKPISSESSGKAPLCEDHIPYNCFSPVSEDVKVDSRDDDENLYNVSTKKRSFGYATWIGDRRIRKILASKYWKVASRVKDEEVSKHDGDLKGTKWERKNFYKRQGSQRIYPFKKRRIFDIDYGSKYDEKIHSVDGEASAKCLRMHANRQSPSKSGQHSLYIARDSRVKLRIKSFKVPELFFEIAETATVGSLKRMVMEAVRALLGGGLHVGVLLQGKKVRDDSKTLLKTGISRENQRDTLGFTLEPSTSVPPVIPQASPTQIPSSAPQPVNRYPLDSAVHQRASGPLPKPQGNNLIEGDRDSGCIADMAIEQSVTVDSKALVPVPTMSREAIPMVPVQQKDKKPDIVQRRVRRPFSVVEVEALVQAVEKLGTGRWRDVKVQAFDDAKHRTYVDLKDKWKTLVHTARISPQQRRGEPVPQELLDRVLTAHAYWSQHQSKQHHSGTPSSYL